MKKFLIFLNLAIFILGIVYLLLPSPHYPDLTNSTRSDEEGDTWQHPDQKGFYTNTDRKNALAELQSKFTLKIGQFTLPSYRLNYRPEDTAQLVREQIQSSYLEEIIYPFRESLFVNGFEPMNYPPYSNLDDMNKPKLYFKNIPYYSKVTLRPVNSAVWARIFVWLLVFPSVYLTLFSLKRSLKND